MPHILCCKDDDWYDLWLSLELLLPIIIDCWIDNVKLVYDAETRTTSNTEGVETRVPGWGTPQVVETLDRENVFDPFGKYLKSIGDALVQMGYVRNVSLRGAPYDFRRAPNENKQWFIDLKALVEDTYTLNSKTPVTFICHSMGCPMSLLFFHAQDQEWKDKYVARFITLSAPWGGLVKGLKVFAVGDDIGVPVLPAKVLRKAQITMPSLAWLLPSPNYWSENEVLVRTLTRDYTINDMALFFENLDYPTAWEMRKDSFPFLSDAPPNVETHCLFGTGVATLEQLSFNGADLKSESKSLFGDGDGTVNERSLRGCAKWSLMQTQGVVVKRLANVEHYYGILKNKDVIQYIVSILTV